MLSFMYCNQGAFIPTSITDPRRPRIMGICVFQLQLGKLNALRTILSNCKLQNNPVSFVNFCIRFKKWHFQNQYFKFDSLPLAEKPLPSMRWQPNIISFMLLVFAATLPKAVWIAKSILQCDAVKMFVKTWGLLRAPFTSADICVTWKYASRELMMI